MIREMNQNDLASINEIGSLIKENFVKVNYIEDRLKKEYVKVYVYDDGLIKGFVEIENHFEITDIINIAVLDRFQHNGIGLKLLDYVIKNTDATKIMLEVNENNKKALNFYKKNKFIEINRRKNYYDGADAIIMERSK